MLDNKMLRDIAKKSGDRRPTAVGGELSSGGAPGVTATRGGLTGRSRSTLRYRRRVRPGEAPLVKALRRFRAASSTIRLPPAPGVVGPRRMGGERQTGSPALPVVGPTDAKASENEGQIAAPGNRGEQLPGPPGDAAERGLDVRLHPRPDGFGRIAQVGKRRVDEYTRELLLLHPAATMTAADVRRSFGRLVGWRGRPARLRCDNGGEFVGVALAAWLPGRGVELTPVAAASPWQNGFVESFHSRLRDEFLDGAGFENVVDATARAARFSASTTRCDPTAG